MARVGKYEIIRPLSRGALTELFLARHEEGGAEPVALKRLLPSVARDMEVVSSFLKEARVASSLNHPNVARILDVNASGKDFFVVTEYVHGLELDEIQQACQKQGFFVPHGVVSQIVLQTCVGLHAAHTATNESGQLLGLVHGNVHPQNILVDMKGHVKMVGLGISPPSRGADSDSADNAYRSPEHCRGEPVTVQSDVFSAGIVLYELCCRRRLFRRKTQLATTRAIMEDPIPPPSAVSDEVPDALEMIIMRALARSPEYRYGTALEMAHELSEAATENGWSGDPGVVAALMSRLLTDDALEPASTPLPEPAVSDYIPAGADEETKLEEVEGLDGLRTPGGSYEEPAGEPAKELRDFWDVTVTPAPLPALDKISEEVPEVSDIPMMMAGEIDDLDEDDARTLVRSPASMPVRSTPADDELVFEMDSGDDDDPLSDVPPPAGAVSWKQQSGASLEMYTDIPEASPMPQVERDPMPVSVARSRGQGMGRETVRVKVMSPTPVSRTNTRAMVLAAVITMLVLGGGVALLFWFMGSGPKLGTVKIASEPAGAKVAVNGKERFGVTPQTISDMALGRRYTVVVAKDGYLPWRKKITLTAEQGELTFKATLERVAVEEGMATLVVQSDEPGARVFLDGELRGKTPLTIQKVACDKKHALVFKREGFLDLVQDVDRLKTGERRVVKVSMTAAESGLEKGVKATSRGAVKRSEDDGPIEIPRAAPPLRRLTGDSVGEILPRRVPKKLDR